ncbi:MAG: TonB family protein [Bacteroidaceae bacterium]|nr:TonB family protein [Bacteroidaceae bacterium]
MKGFIVYAFAIIISCTTFAQDNTGTANYIVKGNECYLDGNYVLAVFWYRKAAEQGDMFGQSNLAYCYEKGLGIGQDYKEAANWYRKAAEQGDTIAQVNLGYLYYRGNGVRQDNEEAKRWFRLAVVQGSESAKESLKEITEMEGLSKKLGVDVSKYKPEIPDVSAEFPGDVYEWLSERIIYPQECVQKGIEGKVSVQFIVEKDGSLDSIKVLRSPNVLLSQEVVRLVKEMPKWKPAQDNGKPVEMRYVLPVIFRLPQEKK